MGTEYVYIERANADHPVYHAMGGGGDRSHWNEGAGISFREWVCDWYEKVRCGRKLTICATFIQRERADLFARPCKRCYREGSDG